MDKATLRAIDTLQPSFFGTTAHSIVSREVSNALARLVSSLSYEQEPAIREAIKARDEYTSRYVDTAINLGRGRRVEDREFDNAFLLASPQGRQAASYWLQGYSAVQSKGLVPPEFADPTGFYSARPDLIDKPTTPIAVTRVLGKYALIAVAIYAFASALPGAVARRAA